MIVTVCDIMILSNAYLVSQMTKIYFSRIYGLSQLLVYSSQKLWNLLSDENLIAVFC